MIKKHFLLALLCISIGALFIRTGVCFELFKNDCQVSNPAKVTDMATYRELSTRIFSGEYTGTFDYQPFYYVIFLPFIYCIFGNAITGVLIAQVLIGALTVLLIGLVAACLWGKRCGCIAACMALCSKMLIFYTPYHLVATLQAFWIILIVYLSIVAMRKRKLWQWALTGLVTSFAILTRGNIWFCVPGCIIAAFYSEGWKKPDDNAPPDRTIFRKLLPVICFTIAVIIPQIPFSWYNSRLTGTFTGPSVAAGKVLALGNSPEAPPGGRNPEFGPGPMEYPPTFNAWMADKDNVSMVSRIFDWIFKEPLVFLELTFRKLILFWDYREIPNNIDIKVNGGKSTVLKIFGFFPTSFIITLGLAGIFISIPLLMKHPGRLLLLYFIIAYWFATSAFYILARFRIPCIPLFIVFGAAFVNSMYQAIKSGDKRNAVRKQITALICGGMVCFFLYDLYWANLEPGIQRLIRPHGVQVDIPEKGLMCLDNGPMTFGGWRYLSFDPRTRIVKRFVIPVNGNFKHAELILPLVWQQPGVLRLLINNTVVSLQSSKPGYREYSCKLTFPRKGTVVIQPASIIGNPLYCVDFQRNYGRTEINNKNPDGELVARLYCY